MKPTAQDAVRRKDSAALRTRSAFVPRKIALVRTVALLAGLIPALLRAEETIVDGVTWCYLVQSSMGNETAMVTGARPDSGNLVVPSQLDGLDVTSIGDKAFYGSSYLTSITIPDGVRSIGVRAFYDCPGLESVLIPDSVTSIGTRAFYGCSGLKSVTIPGQVSNIGGYAFYNCSSLTNAMIPHGEATIGDRAFSGCSRLTAITIPEDTISIGSNAFEGCSKLTSFTIPDGVTSIPFGMFYRCSSLVWVSIPNRVTNIGASAFCNCIRLESFTIPDGVTSIGADAFAGCSSLASVVIPDGISSIENRTFMYCTNLTSVCIPDGVTTIGNYAFGRCSGLTSVTIPGSVTNVGTDAFSDCSGNLQVTANPEWARWFSSATNLSFTIPAGVTSIGDEAFRDCSGLASISIPESVMSIGDDAFRNCTGLESITIPDGVTSIGSHAFDGCSGLEWISLPSGLTQLANDAFSGCDAVRTIVVDPEPFVRFAEKLPGYEERTVSCQGHPVKIGVVPAVVSAATDPYCILVSVDSALTGVLDFSWLGYCIVAVKGSAFFGCSGLTTVVIPADTTSIRWAFYGCSSLRTLFLPSRFDGSTSGMGIPNGCTIRFYDQLCWLRVEAPTGGTTPSFGKTPFCSGDEVECIAPEIEVDPAVDGKRYVFRGWTGSGSVPATGTGRMASFRIEEDSTLVWDCGVQYRIEASVEEGGSTDFGSQWIDLGTTARVDVVSLWPDPFLELSGDVGGIVRSGTSLLVPADRPRSISIRVLSTGSDGSGKPLAWNAGSDWRAGTGESAGCYRSGEIGPSETSVLETSFSGRGIFSFDWRLSANRGHYGRVYLDGRLAGEMNYRSNSWASVRWDLPPGNHTVRWAYEKGTTSATGEDALFLRDIRWLPRLSLAVGSDFGEPVPSAGTHEAFYGEAVDASVPAAVSSGGRVRYCWGWTGTGSVPETGRGTRAAFRLEEDSSIRWLWYSAFSLGEALDAPDLEWTTEGGEPWSVCNDETDDGTACAGSGSVLGENDFSAVQATVSGPGELSWSWKLVSEGNSGVDVVLDGHWQEAASIDRPCDWTRGTLSVSGEGPHVVRFEFWNMGSEGTRGDRAFLDRVSWTGATGPGKTRTTPVPVPHEWLDAHGAGPGADYEAAASALSANGADAVWECYVAGLDPEDPDSRFLAGIGMEDGEPVVTWTPDLGAERAYAVEGRPDLDGPAAWNRPPKEGDRFFRVRVSVPESFSPAPPADYLVRFEPNGGTGAMAGQGFQLGVAQPLFANEFVREGFNFEGWAASPGGAKAYDDGQSVEDLASTQGAIVSLYAVWVAKNYTITFDTMGGSAVAPITAVCGSALVEPDAPTKPGFDFAGWLPAFPETMPPGGATLVAQWTPKNYTITFDTGDGSAVAPITAVYGSAVTAPAAPTKEGFTFAGWNPAFPATMPLGGATLVAQWTPKNYTISFNTGDGSVVAPITAAYGSAVSQPAAPTKDGYAFVGWSPEFPATMPLGGATLVAQWTPKNYTITFDTGDGSAVAPITAAYGSAVTAPAAPTKEGFTFAGWSPAFPATMPLHGATLVAQWTPKNYTITFDTGAGSAVAPITAAYGSAVTAPAAPTKDGYDFAGWNPAFPATMPLNGATLVAQWTPKNYTITFDTGSGSAVAPITAAYGSAVTAPAAPTKEGFTFAGWSPAFPATMPLGGATLVAQWTPKNYTITFDTGNGSVVAPITATYGSAVSQPAAPTKDGYTFAGWSPEFPATMPLGGATLVAQWTPKNYTISFDTGSGSVVAPITAAYGSALTAPVAPTKEGFTFAGWNPAFPATMPLGGATLVAQWTETNANNFTWTVSGNAVTITGVDGTPTGSLVIPNSIAGLPVTRIGNSAFYGCSGLTSIKIPDSVTSIGDNAFRGCSGLTSIKIPDSVTSIGDNVFRGCSGLTSITIPEDVTHIGKSTFYGCSGMLSITIPDGVTSIGDHAFFRCSGLTSIMIPDGVTSIGNSAFYNTGLKTVTIPDCVMSIGESAFSHCSSLASVILPDGWTSIPNFAFSSCPKLTSIMIPDGVSSIGNNAFVDCSGLKSIAIPNSVTNIGNEAFHGCSELTSITIPNGVTRIAGYAFSDCSRLTSVDIPNGVTSIEGNAFSYCIRLTSITIPDSVTSIEANAFSGCSGLTSITIPNSVTSVGKSAFTYCSRLATISIPAALEGQTSNWGLPSTCQIIVRN